MRHEGPAPSGGGPLVERVPYDAAHDLRVAWTYEDFPTLDPTGYFEQARAVSEARGVEVFAAQDDGVPVAYAELERVGDSAEVASVDVDEDHRGRGLGTAITKRRSRRARMPATCGLLAMLMAGRARSTNGSASARSGRCSTSSASRRFAASFSPAGREPVDVVHRVDRLRVLLHRGDVEVDHHRLLAASHDDEESSESGLALISWWARRAVRRRRRST